MDNVIIYKDLKNHDASSAYSHVAWLDGLSLQLSSAVAGNLHQLERMIKALPVTGGYFE